jgi:hypothetical protein
MLTEAKKLQRHCLCCILPFTGPSTEIGKKKFPDPEEKYPHSA